MKKTTTKNKTKVDHELLKIALTEIKITLQSETNKYKIKKNIEPYRIIHEGSTQIRNKKNKEKKYIT